MSSSLAEAIKNESQRIGADPQDFATVISYETGGTFDLWKKGPTTKWGQHRGLIQMGEPQRQKYDYYKGMSAEDAVRASANYLVDNGFKPGMGLLDMYSVINAGGPGRYDASDEATGGAPGTVRDKVEQQMESHKAKAVALLGGDYVPAVASPYAENDAPQNNTGIYDNSRTPPAPSLVQVTQQKAEEAANAPKPYNWFIEQVADDMTADNYTSRIMRWATQGAYDPHDMGWSEDEWKHITETLPERYHDYVLTGSSRYNRDLRLKYATQMAEIDARKAGVGTASSLTSGLIAGALDPVLLPTLIGGPVVSMGRTSLGFAGKVLAGAAIGGTTNAALELGAKYGLDDPRADALTAFGVGALLGGLAGPLAHNTATRVERDMLTKTGLDAIEAARQRQLAKMPSEEGRAISNMAGSGGAAHNTELLKPFDPNDWGIDDAAVDRGFGGKLRFDVAGQLTTSPNPRARMAGFAFFEETAGTKNHAVLEAPASIRAVALERKLLGNRNSVYQVAMREYVAEGSSLLNPIARARRADEFNHAVNAYMVDPHPSPNVSPSVVKAASARKAFYDAWAGELEQAFPGLQVKKEGFYSPKVADHNRISEIDRMVDEETMHKFIAEAIRREHGAIEESLLKKMAKGYWANIRKAGYGIEDSIAGSLALGDKGAFKDAFKRSLNEAEGIADEDLDKVYDLFSGAVDEAAKKPGDNSKGVGYLKRRTVMDYAFSADVRTRTGGSMALKMDDVFIQDAEFLDRRYARSMSGRVAFANTKIRDPKTDELIFDGIRSEADLDKVKNWVREGFRQLGKPVAQVDAQAKNAIENLDFGWKRINGIPVYGQEKAYAQWVRRLKAFQFIRLMSNMGLNQVQESWKVAAMTGFRASMQQLPAIRRMVDEGGRSVPRRDALLAELEHMTGIGLDGLVGKFDFRFADDRIGAGASSRLANGLDMALDWGQRMTAEVSLMRSIQDYQQKWAAKAVAQHLFDMAHKTRTEGGFDLSKLSGKGRERLATVGVGDKEAEAIFGNLLAHAERDGRKLVSLGSNKWDPKAVTEFSYLVNRYTDRLVQTNDVGGLARWMSHPVAQLFTQFRSFVLGAWAKSTLYSLNHMDPRMAVLLVGELAFGAATFAVRQAPQLATDEGYDKYFEETLDPVNLAKNGFARSATASVLPMLMDSALLMTPIGPQFGSARASGAPQDALFGAPVLDQVSKAQTFVKGATNAALKGEELTQAQARAGWSAFVPLGNFLPFSAIFSRMIEGLPDNSRN